MNRFQNIILRFGLTAIILVNIYYALGINYLSNGVQSPVGADAVSVYSSGEILMPILTLEDPSEIKNTGQFVSVYLKHSYLAKENDHPARLTLKIIGIAAVLYLLAGFAQKKSY